MSGGNEARPVNHCYHFLGVRGTQGTTPMPWSVCTLVCPSYTQCLGEKRWYKLISTHIYGTKGHQKSLPISLLLLLTVFWKKEEADYRQPMAV